MTSLLSHFCPFQPKFLNEGYKYQSNIECHTGGLREIKWHSILKPSVFFRSPKFEFLEMEVQTIRSRWDFSSFFLIWILDSYSYPLCLFSAYSWPKLKGMYLLQMLSQLPSCLALVQYIPGISQSKELDPSCSLTKGTTLILVSLFVYVLQKNKIIVVAL